MLNKVPHIIPIDNAAQIFVAINSKKETTMSRIAATLRSDINQERLALALEKVIKRFPFFQVKLKKQFFDWVFERTDELPEIEDDSKWTNRYIDFKDGNFPFRIKVSKNTIALELSHILSDGFGTMSFLITLITEYFKLAGKDIGDSIFIKPLDEDIADEEWLCAFRDKFPQKGPMQKFTRAAYIPHAEMISVEKYFSTRIIMDLESVRHKSRAEHVTMNVYMSAIYTYALQEQYKQDIAEGRASGKRPIRLQIPVNLRRDYPTVCLKNFSYLYSPAYYLEGGGKSFKEIVHFISEHIRFERHSRSIENQVSRNLRAESAFWFKYSPRGVKQMLFRLMYHFFARSQFSGVFTNLGDINLPDVLKEEIESFDVIPCNSPVPGRNTALFSYKGKLEMNIGSSCNDLILEKQIIKKLRDLSIECEIIYKRDPEM